MVDRIGSNSSGLARAAIEAALKRQAEAAQAMSRSVGDAPAAEPGKFASALVDGIRSVNAEVRRTDELATDILAGRIDDISQIAAQLKESDLSLRFALEVRNKFIDAYREVMRMSV